MEQILANWQNVLWSAAILAGAVIVGLILHRVLLSIAARVAHRTPNPVDEIVVRRASGPGRLVLPLLAILMASPGLPLSERAGGSLRHIALLGLIAAAAWFATQMIAVLEEVVAERYRVDVEDNLTARRVRTQFQVIHRVAVTLVCVVALASMLMTFPTVWSFGVGLFASAGAAGLVVGLAARPVLENLLAGLQIALTEPMRIDDVVIVQGEWGRVEEIAATYVVVRIWDLRRLVVPLSYFIQQPFENWTRTSAELLGTVFIYADYTVPVDEVRAELRRIVEGSGLWNGKTCALDVSNATDRAVEMRALVSAANSAVAWNLRCLVREKLIAFLRDRYPESLPKAREVQSVEA